jgi:membrane protease YdiL (CAAX protease family)
LPVSARDEGTSSLKRTWLDALLTPPQPLPHLTASERRREIASTVALSLGLLLYANGDAWIKTRRDQELGAGLNLGHLALLGTNLLWANVERRTPAELGCGRRGTIRSLAAGALVGGLASLIIRFFFAFPLLSRRAVTQPEFRALSVGRLVWLIGVQFLIGSAVVEEIVFRGLLHAKLARLLGVGRALLVGSGVFTAWHLVIAWHNVGRSNLPRWTVLPVYALVLAALFCGGLLFGGLRQATNHLAGSIFSHWLMVANIAWAVARPRGGGQG